jgi:hypothetical protein
LRQNISQSVKSGFERLTPSQNLQAHNFCKSLLAAVERPKSLRLEFESCGHMETVKGADTKFWPVTTPQVYAGVEGILGYARWHPNAVGLILLQLPVHLVSFSSGQFSAEDMLGNGVRPFGSVQCR